MASPANRNRRRRILKGAATSTRTMVTESPDAGFSQPELQPKMSQGHNRGSGLQRGNVMDRAQSSTAILSHSAHAPRSAETTQLGMDYKATIQKQRDEFQRAASTRSSFQRGADFHPPPTNSRAAAAPPPPPPQDTNYATPLTEYERKVPPTAVTPSPTEHVQQTAPRSIDIYPGMKMPFVGFEKTREAMRTGDIGRTTCVECNIPLNCANGAEFVICPMCKCVSPTQSQRKQIGRGSTHSNANEGGVALGYTDRLRDTNGPFLG